MNISEPSKTHGLALSNPINPIEDEPQIIQPSLEKCTGYTTQIAASVLGTIYEQESNPNLNSYDQCHSTEPQPLRSKNFDPQTHLSKEKLKPNQESSFNMQSIENSNGLNAPSPRQILQKFQQSSIHKKFHPALQIHTDFEPNQAFDYIASLRQKIKQTKEFYRAMLSDSPLTEMATHVQTLMQEGSIKPLSSGTCGVYLLCTSEGESKYVIKPHDEEALALNNGKGYASIYSADDPDIYARPGIPIYQSVQNAELAYKIAEIIGVKHITPCSELMILTSNQFADLSDGVNDEIIFMALGAADNEKLCLVQEFIPNCKDITTIIEEKSGSSLNEIKDLSEEEQNRLCESFTDLHVDQQQYEECAILAWVIGEKDGNGGNFLVSDQVNSNGFKNICKIDNAASLAENNDGLISGLNSLHHNFQKPLSQKSKDLIQNINFAEIIKLMESRGKSKAVIEAMQKRIDNLKYVIIMYAPNSIDEFEASYEYELEEQGEL